MLAASAVEGVIPDGDSLRAALSPLPLAILDLDERALADLSRIGLRRVGDLLRERLGRLQLPAPVHVPSRARPFISTVNRAFVDPGAEFP